MNLFKSLAIVATLAYSATTLAQSRDIEFFVGGKPGGINYEITQELQQQLSKKNYKINVNVTGSCDKGQNEFLGNSRPSLMIVLNGQTSSAECGKVAPTDKSLVTAVFTAPVMVCGKPGKDNLAIISRKEKVTIGASSDYPAEMVTSLNPNFKYVPYPNSGAMLAGFLAGDTDFVIANMSRSSKLINEKKGDCFVVTGKTDVLGVKAATKTYPEWSYNQVVQAVGLIQNNLNTAEVEKLRKDLQEIFSSPEWKTFADKNKMTVNPGFTVKEFNDTGKQWVVKK